MNEVGDFSVDHILAVASAAEKLTFADISERYWLYACCKTCKYKALINSGQMIRKLGVGARIIETGRRLRCTRCNVRGTSHFVLQKIPRNA
jgi:hypothetical protein